MDTRVVLNRFELAISEVSSPSTTAGLGSYVITPCPQTGSTHDTLVRTVEDFPWATVECYFCGWLALAIVDEILPNTLPPVITNSPYRVSRSNRTNYVIETLVPDDTYQQDGSPIHLWQDPTTDTYHTHDRMPVPDPNDPNEFIWPTN